MAYLEDHDPVKEYKIAQAAAVALEENLVVPAVFQREGIEQFKGAKDDTINVKVEGVLPHRRYGWRNDRSAEIQFDEYKERTIAVTFGDDIYSAVRLTDEQRDFDFMGWAKLVGKQTDAVGDGLERYAIAALKSAPFQYTVGVHESKLRQGLIEARRVMNALRAPGPRTILVGTNWESALLNDEKLNLAQNVGESEAVSALRNATIGQRFGFNIVVAQELDPDEAVALVPSAFIFATGAPSVPVSVKHGAQASHNGVALRWVTDYDMTRTTDRSLVNTYQSFRHVDDVLIGHDENDQAFVSEYEHFVRAIKLDLNGQNVYADPNAADGQNPSDAELAEAELASITGLTPKADVSTAAPTGPVSVTVANTPLPVTSED